MSSGRIKNQDRNDSLRHRICNATALVKISPSCHCLGTCDKSFASSSGYCKRSRHFPGQPRSWLASVAWPVRCRLPAGLGSIFRPELQTCAAQAEGSSPGWLALSLSEIALLYVVSRDHHNLRACPNPGGCCLSCRWTCGWCRRDL